MQPGVCLRTGTAPSRHPQEPLGAAAEAWAWTGSPTARSGAPLNVLCSYSCGLFAGAHGARCPLRLPLGLLLRAEGGPGRPWQEGQTVVRPRGCCLLSRLQNLPVLIGSEAAVPLGVIELPDPLDTPTLESPASSQEGWVEPAHTGRGTALAPGRSRLGPGHPSTARCAGGESPPARAGRPIVYRSRAPGRMLPPHPSCAVISAPQQPWPRRLLRGQNLSQCLPRSPPPLLAGGRAARRGGKPGCEEPSCFPGAAKAGEVPQHALRMRPRIKMDAHSPPPPHKDPLSPPLMGLSSPGRGAAAPWSQEVSSP